MKQVVILLLLAMPFMGEAQSKIPFITKDLNELLVFSNGIKEVLKNQYQIVKIDSSSKRNIEIALANRNSDTIFVTVLKQIVGENKSLEIPGHKEYSLTSISGRYLDLFNVWKVYFDDNSDVEEIAKKKSAIKVLKEEEKRINFVLSDNSNRSVIRIKHFL